MTTPDTPRSAVPLEAPVGPPSPRRSWQQSLTLALLAVSALLGAVLVYDRVTNPLSLFGTAYPAGTAAPELSGTGQDGRPLSLGDLKGQTVAVFFGFLNCPNICPTTLAALERARAELPEDQRADFQTLLVSVDPKRDTTAKMKEYVTYFDPTGRGLLIPEPQLTKAAAAWGAGYTYSDVKGPTDYQVNHTTGVYLVDARGDLRLVWDYTQVTTDAARIAQDVRAVMK